MTSRAPVAVRVDDQIFGYQRRGGISRYFVELMRAFNAWDEMGVEIVTGPFWSSNEHLLEAGLGRKLPARWDRRRLAALANRPSRRKRATLVHHTYYDPSYLRRGPGKPLRVVTVYDMIPELHPSAFGGANPHLAKRAYVEAADLVLCISETTKHDLVEVYGRPRAPVVVTPLGVSRLFTEGSPEPPGLPADYVLFVGTRVGYKDFDVLLAAFALADLPRQVALVVAGGGALSAAEQQAVTELGLAGRVTHLPADDRTLAGAYAHALCFVFPSRYEGFGIPTLEAMSSGCPTILASSGSHREVGGDAAEYFAPGDPADLARALTELVSDVGRRRERRAAGTARASEFTWERTARLTADAYRSVVASGPA